MNPLLKRAKDIFEPGCVSIIFNTHRTKPDNEQDPIRLKNLLKEAEERLIADVGDDQAHATMKLLQECVETIDHNFNLESMVLFANAQFSDVARLPIAVEDRVVIDDTFATRDLVRAMNLESAYYLLVFSRQQARLLEAFNDRLVREVGGAFPFENTVYTTNPVQQTDSERLDNLLEEFFNRVDKHLQTALQEHPLPVVLVSDQRNLEHYRKVSNQPEFILTTIHGSKDNESAQRIILDAWEEVQQTIQQRIQDRLGALETAQGQGKVLSDYTDIWKAIQEGRGQTLYVQQDLFQPALVDKEQYNILLLDAIERKEPGAVDDLIDEMIEQNRHFGGDTVFLEGDQLEPYQGLALITRY